MSISGNAIVDEISNMRINSIPEAWYRTVRQGKQPNALAILVLWDLLYWYKWTEIRDESSGLFLIVVLRKSAGKFFGIFFEFVVNFFVIF